MFGRAIQPSKPQPNRADVADLSDELFIYSGVDECAASPDTSSVLEPLSNRLTVGHD